MKTILTLLLFVPIFCFSQESLEQELDSIATTEDAKSFAKTHKKANKSKFFTFNKEKHKTRLADDLFKLSKGGKKVIKTDFKTTYYKIIDKKEVNYSRFNIIVFDEANKAKRDEVLAKYNEGYKFKDLAKHHSSGPTAKMGGDTGWIKPGDLSTAFDETAFNSSLNSIVTIDDNELKKYYIVIKTEDKTPIEEITVLKFTEATK
jgi:parvulin-like peptidyl-prolyl isomerase